MFLKYTQRNAKKNITFKNKTCPSGQYSSLPIFAISVSVYLFFLLFYLNMVTFLFYILLNVVDFKFTAFFELDLSMFT